MKLRFLVIFLLLSFVCFSQRQANIWYFGNNAGLDFNSGTPVALLDGALSTLEGCATISDADGNLLFYTDGTTVYNRDHAIMLNGTGLNGDPSSTHSAIIVPRPENANIYYIFTAPAVGESMLGMEYSEVDMTLDGGLGGVTSIKNISLTGLVTEKLTAIRSSIANEYWVVGHLFDSDEFVSFNISSFGVNETAVTSAVGTFVGGVGAPITVGIGQIKNLSRWHETSCGKMDRTQ